MRSMSVDRDLLVVDADFVRDGPQVDDAASARYLAALDALVNPDSLPPPRYVAGWAQDFINTWVSRRLP